MEKYSPDTLRNASQGLYNLSEQVQKYYDAVGRLNRLTVERSNLDKKLNKNPYAVSFAFGGIGAGLGLTVMQVIAFLTNSLAYTAALKIDSGLAELVLTYLIIMTPLRLIIYPVLFYFIVVLISFLIMKFTGYKESYSEKIKSEISENKLNQLRVKNEINHTLNALRGEKSILPYIPQPYQYPEAIKKFGDYFAQGRAKTIKDAANLFEEEKRYIETQNQLRQINNNIAIANTMDAVDCVIDALFIASLM